MNSKWYSVVAFSFFLAACGTIQTAPQTSTIQKPAETKEKDPYKAFCKDMIARLNERDFAVISDSLNVQLMARNALVGRKLNAQQKQSMEKIFHNMMGEAANRLSGSFEVVESWFQIDTPNSRRCIMHSDLNETSGLLLFEFTLAKKNQTVEIVDWRDFGLNTVASSATASVFFSIMNISQAEIAGESTAPSTPSFKRYISAIKENNIEEAWSAFQQLPDPINSNGMYLGILLRKLTHKHPLYFEIMGQYDGMVDESSRGLVLLDYYSEKKEYAKALALVDSLEGQVAKDSVFDLLRASIYRQSNNDKQFLAHIIKTIDSSTTYEDAYWVVLDYFIEKQLYSDALLTLEILEDTFGYMFTTATFKEVPEYSALLTSSEYQQWSRLK